MPNEEKKKDWTISIIIIAIIIIAGWLMLRPTDSKESEDLSGRGQYSEDLKRISDKYSRCMEDSEYGPTNQSDPMEGTNLSRENVARNSRDDCQRQYNFQKRALEIRYRD